MSFTDKKTLSVADAVKKIMEASVKKADKDYDKDGKVESPKDEVWGSRMRAAKMAGKLKEEEQLDELKKTTVSSYAKKATSDAVQKTRDADYEDEYGDPGEAEKLEKKVKNRVTGVNRAINRLAKEEIELDEAFPTVADGEKSLKAKEGKTTHGKITKTKTGMKHERDYDDQPEPEVKRGRGRPKKRLSEMRQEYFNYIEEEVDNETFKKELEDQKAKFDGKKKGADVAKASVQAVKVEEVELDERTLSSDEMSKREDYVKGMKKKMAGFKQRYGERAKSVMYATATKMAKKD